MARYQHPSPKSPGNRDKISVAGICPTPQKNEKDSYIRSRYLHHHLLGVSAIGSARNQGGLQFECRPGIIDSERDGGRHHRMGLVDDYNIGVPPTRACH